jgi:16S rRNA (uracil1498-N3)-methyltransferase
VTRRIFVPRQRIAGSRAELDGSTVHYLTEVLRLAPGAAVEVFDGEGMAYPARWDGPGSSLELGPPRAVPPPAARVWLAPALAKGEKMDWVVQKCTELGVERVLPFSAARSVVKLAGVKGEERSQRWERIAAAAARQCGRAEVPQVAPPAPLAQVLASVPEGFSRLVFFEGGGEPLAAAPGAEGHFVVVGPEGGLSREEIAACVAAGCKVATLGPRVLRAETAAVVAVALLQHLHGDLGRAPA